MPRRADCAVLRGGAGGRRGRGVAVWPCGAGVGRGVRMQGGWWFFKVGVEMKQGGLA